MNTERSVRAVVFDLNNVLVSNDASAGFSCYLAEKAKEDPRIDTLWSGDVQSVLFGLLTKYCPLCDYQLCTQYPRARSGWHVKVALKEGRLTYEHFKAATTYMLTHYVTCDAKVRIVLDHAADYFCRPHRLMETAKSIEVGMKLFHHAVELFGPSRVFILSNMPTEVFSLFKSLFPAVCQSIPESHQVISGHVGVAKPHPNAFQSIIAKVGESPSSILLIDDLAINVEAARREGMQALQFSRRPSAELVAWYRTIGFVWEK